MPHVLSCRFVAQTMFPQPWNSNVSGGGSHEKATPTLDKYRYQGQDTFPLATFCPTHVICQLGEYA